MTTRKLTVYLSDDLDRALRVFAATHRLTLSEVAGDAFTQHLEAHAKKTQEATTQLAS